MKLAVCIILILLSFAMAFGFYLASYAMRIQRQSLPAARAWQDAHYDISWYDGLEKRDYEVASYDGYVLHVQLLKNPAPADRYILISHGYTDNRFGSLKYAQLYLKLGFNVIIYDLRGHGLNAPTFCTYSVRESRDLASLIRDSRARYPEAKLFGLHGESLGAATSVAVVRYKPDVDFVVADCGFGEITSILSAGMKRFHLPGWLVYLAAPCAKLRYGVSFSEMRPIDALKDNAIPILFIHGDSDGFIPCAHSEAMRRATAGMSELRLIHGAKHAASIFTSPDEYERCVSRFIERLPMPSPQDGIPRQTARASADPA